MSQRHLATTTREPVDDETLSARPCRPLPVLTHRPEHRPTRPCAGRPPAQRPPNGRRSGPRRNPFAEWWTSAAIAAPTPRTRTVRGRCGARPDADEPRAPPEVRPADPSARGAPPTSCVSGTLPALCTPVGCAFSAGGVSSAREVEAPAGGAPSGVARRRWARPHRGDAPGGCHRSPSSR